MYPSPTRSPYGPSLNSYELEFMKAIIFIERHEVVPGPDVYGDVGYLRLTLEALEEALLTHGRQGYDEAKDALFRHNPRLPVIYAYCADAEDAETTTGTNGEPMFVTLRERDLRRVKPPRYLISGILKAASVSLLHGMANTGKTFNALHIAQCVARGIDWNGRAVQQGPVLYICAEGGKAELMVRSIAWCQHHGASPCDDLHFIARPVHLLNDRRHLLGTLDNMLKPPTLIVIDTFSNCAIGINQNDQREVTQVLMAVHEISQRYQCHVLIVHHANWSDKVNGSAAFLNHVDTMIKLTRESPDSPIMVTCDKQRGAAYFQPLAMNLHVVDLGTLDPETQAPVTSCVLVPSEEKAEPGLYGIYQMVYNLLTTTPIRSHEFRELASEKGLSEHQFHRAVKALTLKGLIQRSQQGPRVFYHLPDENDGAQQDALNIPLDDEADFDDVEA